MDADFKQWYLNTDPERGGWVYLVIDAREPLRIRYVGKTQVSIQERATGHWYDSRRTSKPMNSRMVNWLPKRADRPQDVLFVEQGFYPTRTELNYAEYRLIADYKELGMADLNISEGGEGQVGRSIRPETRAKMKASAHRGEDHHNTTLTWKVVNQARKRAQETYYSYITLAEDLDISRSNAHKILSNVAWYDPNYDPSTRLPRPASMRARGRKVWTAKLDWPEVNEIRRIRQEKWIGHEELARIYGVGKSNIGYILNNENWHDPEYDPATLKKRGQA